MRDFRRGQLLWRTHRAVPGVALHVVTTVARQRGDRRDRQRMARAWVTASETAAVAGEEMRLLGRDSGTLGIGDAAVSREGSTLATARDLGRLGRIDQPRVKKVEVARRRVAAGHVGHVRQTCGRVLGGEARDVECGPHRLLERGARIVRRARVAAPLPEVDRDAQRLVTIALDVFEVALAHRHRQPGALGHFNAGVARAQAARESERILDQLLEGLARVGKAVRRGGLGRTGKAGHGIALQRPRRWSTRGAGYHTDAPVQPHIS